MMTRLLTLVIVMTLLATACGSDDASTVDVASDDPTSSTDTGDAPSSTAANDGPSSTDSPSTSEEADEDFSGDDSGDFCAKAREFDENDPLDDVGLSMSPAFFEEAEELFSEVISIAPDEIRGDFETSLDGIQQMGALLEKYDYNFFDEELGAEMDALDTAALDASSERIDAYLQDVCGIDTTPDIETLDDIDLEGLLPDGIDPTDLEGIDPSDLEGFELDPNVAQTIFDSFGIDEELATCLTEEFGEDFDLDTASADPSFMTQEVCGTTLLEILSGIGQG